MRILAQTALRRASGNGVKDACAGQRRDNVLSRVPMLNLTGVTVRLGGRLILDRASASIPARSRVGLVGRNGTGKSTLLKIVAGLMEADAGAVDMPKGTRIGYLAQEIPGGAASPFETVLAADAERMALIHEAETSDDAHRLGAIHDRFKTIDAYAAPARAGRILAGLGFDVEAQHRPLSSFSGGWRMRVGLAALLFAEPDLLLLDEPSNHLDLESAVWLESFLKSYRGTLLLVSHERDLLNHVADHILHLKDGRLTLYPGGYDEFERQRRERAAQSEALREKQESQRAKLQAYIDRWRYKAHTARQAQSRMKALARLEPIAEAAADSSATFNFPSPGALRPPLVTLDGAAAGYDGKPVIARMTLRIDPDDRIALLGRNGNGKTTFARLIAGQISPMAGAIKVSQRLHVGYFAQHHIEALAPEETPIEHMARALPQSAPGAVRAQLARFGLGAEKAEIKVRHLSGGECARLALALVTREAPHMLILDEPTNHLDVDAREALVAALNDYEGAVIVVSHDRHLIELAADRLLLVADGTVRDYAGSLDDYRAMILEQRLGSEAPAKPSPPRRDERRDGTRQRASGQRLRKAVEAAEAELLRLAAQRDEIDRSLADPELYRAPKNDALIADLSRTRAEIDRAIAAAETRWLAASEALDTAAARGA